VSHGNGSRSGWIKLHRSLLDHPRFKDPDWIAVWTYLLLNATHQPYRVNFDGHRVELQPGQLVTGRHAISRATGVNDSKVKRVLAVMKDEQQIVPKSGVRGSIITIRNWKRYQGRNPLIDKRPTSNRPATSTKATNKLTSQHRAKRPTRMGGHTPSAAIATSKSTSDKNPSPQKVTTNKKTRKDKRGNTHSARHTVLLRAVKTEAARFGMPKAEAAKFFHHFNARGWVDRHGNPITNWRSLLRTWKPNGGGVERSTMRKTGGLRVKKPLTIWELKTTLEVAEAELKRLGRSRPSSYATPEQTEAWRKTPDGQKYVAMKKRRDDLRAKLAAATGDS
jgi:hypothetical protein